MKQRILLTVAMMLCCVTMMFAQNNKLSYQAVLRDSENQLVSGKTVEVTVNIYNGDAAGNAVYSETHTTQTNLNGMVSLIIGNGTVTRGSWNAIQWKTAIVTTEVSIDGTSLGTVEAPLTAVPYAMFANELNPESAALHDLFGQLADDSTALAKKCTPTVLLCQDKSTI